MTERQLVDAIQERVVGERARMAAVVDEAKVTARIHELFSLFTEATTTEQWRYLLPGKPILSAFAGHTRFSQGRLKTMYINTVAGENLDTFSDILQIFQALNGIAGLLQLPRNRSRQVAECGWRATRGQAISH